MEPLSLKYRPKRFGDIVGQKATRAVLAKIVESGELPPSMIFAGVRGTGKTSAARIVAKAINCTQRDGFEPCGECESCGEIEAGSAPYVVEIDAASHGSAEAMRTLVEDARYSSGDHWKVYVLDEVHSVSTMGFQVLLKTLEEPPPRTAFILVTTEPERIPETIQARSMLFRFGKITMVDLNNRLQVVSEIEDIKLEDDARTWIAEFSNGGMRDALMTLDQVHRLGVSPITVSLLRGVFGEQSVGRWIEALLGGNPAKAVLVADELVAQHGSVGTMIDKAILTLRAVLLAKAGQGPMPGDIAEHASRLTQGQAIEMIKRLWAMRDQVRRMGPDERAAVVALSAEMARTPTGDVDEMIPKLTDAQLEEALRGG